MTKLKLVVFGSDWDVYLFAFRDFIDDPKVEYIPTFRPQGWKGWLHRLMFNPKVNRYFNIPGKGLWNKTYVKAFPGDNYCFLVLENWLRWESATGFLAYLRLHFPHSKIVCFAQDLVPRIVDLYTGKVIDVEYVKQYSDAFITYDINEAEKYGLPYAPTVFSPLHIPAGLSIEKSDVFFLGRDKNRLDMLVHLCRKLTSKGLKCSFYVLDVPRENQIAAEGIHYISTPMRYEENLQHVMHTECVLEILQENAKGATFRLWEAIALNKKLVTNNLSVRESGFYDEKYISTFTGEADIDMEFVCDRKSGYPTANPYAEHIRPASLVKFIERMLDVQIDITS